MPAGNVVQVVSAGFVVVGFDWLIVVPLLSLIGLLLATVRSWDEGER